MNKYESKNKNMPIKKILTYNLSLAVNIVTILYSHSLQSNQVLSCVLNCNQGRSMLGGVTPHYNVVGAPKNPFEAAAGKSSKLSKTGVCTEVPITALQDDGIATCNQRYLRTYVMTLYI